MYADDILTLCSSQEQLRVAIQTIEKWSADNGMTLNKKKSGIVPFAHRRARKIPFLFNKKTTEIRHPKYRTKKNPNSNPSEVNHYEWVIDTKDFLGIPICLEYKYLGTILTPKLCCDAQIKFIKRKAAHLNVKLGPYLRSASCEARRDAFMTFVLPLFNATMMLITHEESKTHRETLERSKKMIFKQFMGISKSTSTELVEDMLRVDIQEMAQQEFANNMEKWRARVNSETIDHEPSSKVCNSLKGMPNDWANLINSQYKKCPKCPKKITDRWHLLYAHGIRLKPIIKIWKEEILPITNLDNTNKARQLLLTERQYNNGLLTEIVKKHWNEASLAISKISL